MKTYSRLLLLAGIFIALFTVSFTTYNACDFASKNNTYIKTQTELAFEASNFNMAKYHAYKALTGIERAKNNFKDCGCEMATKSINRTKDNLKNGTRSPSLKDAKVFFEIALKNTSLSIEALQTHKQEKISSYGDGFLILNTAQSSSVKDDIISMEGNTLSQKIESGIAKFKSSLDQMIEVNDCEVALDYVQKTHESSQLKAVDSTLSPGKRYYHKRITDVTAKALQGFKKCK